jgi:hypothetical protein
LDKMSACGVSFIYVRTVNDDLGALLYLIGVGDAILLNKKILANEEIPKEEVERRIGLIQMMENITFVGIGRCESPSAARERMSSSEVFTLLNSSYKAVPEYRRPTQHYQRASYALLNQRLVRVRLLVTQDQWLLSC